MSRWVAKSFYRLRHLLMERVGVILVGLALWLLATGRFAQPRLAIPTASLLTMAFAYRAVVGWRRPAKGLRRLLDQVELGLLLLGSVYAVIQLAGGPGSWAQPLAYVAVAYLVGFNRRLVGGLLTVVALGWQVTVHVGGVAMQPRGAVAWDLVATQGAYIILFAVGNFVFLQAEVARRRREHEQRVSDEIRAMQDEARDFRLISSSLVSMRNDRELAEAKLMRGAVESIHQSMFFTLDLLKKTLGLQTCVLLWLDSSGKELRIKELVTDSQLVTETPIPAQAGAVGGIVKNRILLNLRSLRRGAQGIPYYQGPEEVGAFVGVPVLEDGHLRGVLCADRKGEQPFSTSEEELLVQAARHVLRGIQNERVFSAVERAKYEHERFYRASTMLNQALTLAEVYETAFAAAEQIMGFDFGALTLYDQAQRRHTIVKVVGEGAEGLEGQSFRNNAGLVAMVVKNRHYLPVGEIPRNREAMLFTRKLRVQGMDSMVVLPLIIQDQAIGSFVLAAEAVGRFPKKVREMLGVISNQVAVSVENAKMYKRMEEMATTDGLTGLPNHRTFQARFSEMLHRAERNGKPVSVLLTDVDKFKLVNDTYGHPVGDRVLKRVAKVLAGQVRKVDVVARYGGEEFAIVLEETDVEGALLLAERVRQELAAQVMNSDKGAFRVTMSLGIASYPQDGKDKQLLIERADQALYHAKESGRNRSVHYQQMAVAQRSAVG
ncbi:MAG: diguanylate cyclase [Deltaproteobacteria bacterium]|nr:diguanylate cyclase [Deltaproteobacteria bacterium]